MNIFSLIANTFFSLKMCTIFLSFIKICDSGIQLNQCRAASGMYVCHLVTIVVAIACQFQFQKVRKTGTKEYFKLYCSILINESLSLCLMCQKCPSSVPPNFIHKFWSVNFSGYQIAFKLKYTLHITNENYIHKRLLC